MADYNNELHNACRAGDMQLVQSIIQENSNLAFAMKGSGYGGHIDIIKYLIERGATNYNCGAYGACHGGFYDVVKYLIDLGADDFSWLFVSACQGGNLNIVKLVYETAEMKKSDVSTNDLQMGLHCVCCHEFDDIAKYIIDIVNKKKRVIDMDFVLSSAHGNMANLVKTMMK